MIDALVDSAQADSGEGTPLVAVTPETLEGWKTRLSGTVTAWIGANGYKGEPGSVLAVPDLEGALACMLVGVEKPKPGTEKAEALWALASLPAKLPPGTYKLDPAATRLFGAGSDTALALGWALGTYAFSRYKKAPERTAHLIWPQGADKAEVERLADGIGLARDLINTPAEDMGPAELAAAARKLAEGHGAKFREIVGDDLLAQNYPLIHAVGRASTRPPRLIDLTWGDADAPKLTLVGKGVCFDSGGLDLKPAAGMKLMKKDMGGAATVLGLASAIMAAKLKLRLRVLIPAVDNAVAGDAFRPMDIFRSRKGLTVEIGNTDAEGRLVLCDALAEAASEKPALLIDMATLTGAARVALGPDLPALFANDEAVAADLLAAGEETKDPFWRLPLWKPYAKQLESKTADLNNAPEGGMAGSITAALYLQAFVEEVPWVHIDTFAWNPAARPGRPEGGEALGLRALYHAVAKRFGK